MTDHAWVNGVDMAITVCDAQGIITEMNPRAEQSFAQDGGLSLIGKSLMDCHGAASRAKLQAMLANHEPNEYTIEKNGVKKMIIQLPFFEQGQFKGLVELSVVIPWELPHFIRPSE